MSYDEDDLLPISAIQHLLFCERQCALIHLERLWEENVLTAEGRQQHDRADQSASESHGDLLIARSLMIQSLRLGLAGRADVVEFHRVYREKEKSSAAGDLVALPEAKGWWRVFPIEYKRGSPKPGLCDAAQLCAQALCLEEMLEVSIESGALFYNKPHRRKDVAFDAGLRSVVKKAALRLHGLIDSGETPPAVDDKRCPNCSLVHLCLPHCSSGRFSAKGYVQSALRQTAVEKYRNS